MMAVIRSAKRAAVKDTYRRRAEAGENVRRARAPVGSVESYRRLGKTSILATRALDDADLERLRLVKRLRLDAENAAREGGLGCRNVVEWTGGSCQVG